MSSGCLRLVNLGNNLSCAIGVCSMANIRLFVRIACSLLAVAACALLQNGNRSSGAEVRVEVDAAKVVHVMRGGLGASWHAIEKPMPVTPGGDPQFGRIIETLKGLEEEINHR